MIPSIARSGRGWKLSTEVRIERPIQDVFGFFADANNLNRLTPGSLHFRIMTPQPIEMRQGAMIDYSLKLHGMPIKWRTEISRWEPPFLFVDQQLHGPYRWWIHEHRFEQVGAVVRVMDDVYYGVPGGALVHSLVVRRDLRNIFNYRTKALHHYFHSSCEGNSDDVRT